MNSEFNEPDFDSAAEVKDRTLWWWGAVGILAIVLIAALWIWGRSDPNVSRVRLRHILISYDANDPADRARAREKAEELRRRILAGESFSKLAKEWSSDPKSASRGGDLNYHRKGTLEQSIEEFAWSAPVGEVSEVLQTQHGFHIVRIEDRHLSEADKYDLEMKKRAMEGDDAEQQ
ncbi:MAG: peptidylprolyl isomerase [Candidatus Hydrogenedentota bacterium]